MVEQVLSGKPGKEFPADIFRVVVRKVAMLEVAKVLDDLSVPR